MIAHQTAAQDLRALAVAAVLDRAHLPVAHPVVRLVLQPVPEIEEEKEVVVKALRFHGDTKIRKRKGKKKEKGKGIGTRKEIVKRKERKGTMLFPKKLNKKDDPGIIFVIKLTLILFIINYQVLIIFLISQISLSA